MKAFFSALPAIFALLALNIGAIHSQAADDRLAPEKECLRALPTDKCNLEVTYGTPVDRVQCDQKIPETDENIKALNKEPGLKISSATEAIPRGILVSFDPDARMSNDAKFGFIHWLANVTGSANGDVTIVNTLIDYYPPTPPEGNGWHRYQFFVFSLSPGSSVSYSNSRRFSLCDFIKDNNLDQPVASTQYQYERRKRED
ncbi:hypothetical protein BsWGS_09736 [Bradybaena similaris]